MRPNPLFLLKLAQASFRDYVDPKPEYLGILGLPGVMSLHFQTCPVCPLSIERRTKTLVAFHYTGCLIGVRIRVYDNPHITGQYNPLYTLNNPGSFHCSIELPASKTNICLHFPPDRLLLSNTDLEIGPNTT